MKHSNLGEDLALAREVRRNSRRIALLGIAMVLLGGAAMLLPGLLRANPMVELVGIITLVFGALFIVAAYTAGMRVRRTETR